MLVEYETRTQEYYQKIDKRRNAQRLYRATLLTEMIGKLDKEEIAVVLFKSKGMNNEKERIVLEREHIVCSSDLIALRKAAFSAYDSLSRPLFLDEKTMKREKKEDPNGKELADQIVRNTKRIAASIKNNLYVRPYREGEEEEILESEAKQRLRGLRNLIEWRSSINDSRVEITEGKSQYSINLDDEIRIAGMQALSVLITSEK